MRANSNGLARVTVGPDDIPALLAFAAAHPVPDLPASPERLLGPLVGGPQSIIDLRQDGKCCLVAAVIDTCANSMDAAELLVVGLRDGAPSLAQVTLLLDEAERSAARGPRRGLEIPLTAAIAPYEALLRRRGYDHAYDLCTMTASLAGAPEPADDAWCDLDPAALDATRDLLLAAFATMPGTGTPGISEFRRNAADASAGTRRVLALEGRIAAYVHVVPPPAPGGVGEINVIARHPRLRGRGLGERAIGEALRRLRAAGAVEVRLDVVAINHAALALYERHGFRLAGRQQVLHRRLAH